MLDRPPLAVALDFDGLLMDSEPFWHEAEMYYLKENGIQITPKQALETTGLRCDEALCYWRDKFSRNDDFDVQLLQIQIENMVIDRIRERGELRPGAFALVDFLRSNGVDFGVVSSSPKRLIVSGLIKGGFSEDLCPVFSTENHEFGKPNPSVYIEFCKYFKASPQRCLAFEDSLNGVLAAKSARMNVFAVPEVFDDTVHIKFSIADQVMESLEQLDFDTLFCK